MYSEDLELEKIVIAADHGGFELKELLVEYLQKNGYQVIDLGTNSSAAVDYPDFALKLGESLIAGNADVGILLCGSGVGACIAVNKIPGIRAGICHDTYSAHQGREHDDMNVLCLGARVIGPELAFELVKVFLNAKFSGQERHVRRLEKIAEIERRFKVGVK